jgi:hypothetical protein
MNVSKCEILTKKVLDKDAHPDLKTYTEKIKEKEVLKQSFLGIPVLQEVKYLGLKLSANISQMISRAVTTTKKFGIHFGGKINLGTAKNDMRSTIVKTYCDSLILYYLTPFIAVNSLSRSAATKIVGEHLKGAFGLPKDMSGTATFNVFASIDPNNVIAKCLLRAKAMKEKLNLEFASKID